MLESTNMTFNNQPQIFSTLQRH